MQSNQVWCWDISYLPTLIRGVFYYLYLIKDIYSRHITGFRVVEEGAAATEFLFGAWFIRL